MSSDSNKSVQLYSSTGPPKICQNCNNNLFPPLWYRQYPSNKSLDTVSKLALMHLFNVYPQQKVTMLYCFLGFSPVVRQNPKCQVLSAGSHHAVPHAQWQSHHRSPCPATAVSSHCSLPLESANASMCGARCLKWLGILNKSFKEQKECYRSESLSSWL